MFKELSWNKEEEEKRITISQVPTNNPPAMSRIALHDYQDLLSVTLRDQKSTEKIKTYDDDNDNNNRWDDLVEARSRFVLYLQTRQHLLTNLYIHACSENCASCYDLSTHRCSSHCELFQYKYIFICTRTGNLHYCTSVLCDRLDQEGEYACELTGIIHGLAIDYSKTRQSEKQYKTKGRSRNGGGGAGGGGDGAVVCDTDQVYMGPAILSTHIGSMAQIPEYKPGTKRKRANRVEKDRRNIEREKATITTVVSTLITQAMPKLANFKQKIIDACHLTWSTIIWPSELYRKHPNRYTIQYHCVIILYELFRKGIVLDGVDRYVIVPRLYSPDLNESEFSSTRKLTELDIEFKHKHRFSSSTLTATEEIYLECLSSLFDQFKHHEQVFVTFLVTRALHHTRLNQCDIVCESECSKTEFLMNYSDAVTIATRQPLDVVRVSLGSHHRQNARAIHISVDIDSYNNALYTITVET